MSALLCFVAMGATAQKFFNLTADEVSADSVVPMFSYAEPIAAYSADSVYSFEIAYPEFVAMSPGESAAYRRLSSALPPELPVVSSRVVRDRGRRVLACDFCPIVYRGGQYMAMASFMLRRVAVPAPARQSRVAAAASRYKDHSVLASGRWVKIRVGSTGVYQLSDALVRKAGFSDPSRVKIYGYGGNLRQERLSGDDIAAHDDLAEVPTCSVGGKRLFYARGPVSWSSNDAARRTRNYYSDYGYYFLTEGDGAPQTVDSAAFVASFYPSAEHYHYLHENDGYSWYNGGRNLFDSKAVSPGDSLFVDIPRNPNATEGWLSVNITSSNYCRVQVAFNDSIVGTLTSSNSSPVYKFGCEASRTFYVHNNALGYNSVKLTVLEGSNSMRLDYASIAWDKPYPLSPLQSADVPVPEYVCAITNQDHHADPNVDMVIIIPTSQKLLKQAQRVKTFHEQNDSMSVAIVPADELYNEFSSGTPDASAYRLYLKMMYDRAESTADMPKYLLLFGDCVWDNRLLTAPCRALNADDLLLAFESEESFDKRTCYIDDGFYALLDDGEGTCPLYADKLDLAVGRFPVSTDAEAKIMVDKTISYATNLGGGAWQNTIMFMGDDGNQNQHMDDANRVADEVIAAHPEYTVKKVMWDAYKRETAATGNTYPEVTKLIKQQQQQGALIMDYAGHGSEIQISHEKVLRITDFQNFSNTNLPLWVTASCDIMPFDGVDATIGEAAVLNEKGGAVAFYGTTRTVYADQNTLLNSAFMRFVLTYDDSGQPIAIGEAQRLAKNTCNTKRLADNSLQYSLLGDPALRLKLPTAKAVIDSINGTAVASTQNMATLKAGQLVCVKGHIEGQDNFNGKVTLCVRDNLETVRCRLNDKQEADTAFVYTDRNTTIFNGSNIVKDGRFEISFAVPKDINYSNATGLANVFAISDDRKSAHGYCDRFVVGGSMIADNDSIGPSIYCYLNSPSFTNGGNVNSTPYFVAEIKDRDGINASGSGIGHDMQLIIDGREETTYSLNENFNYDFGSYTSGSTYYNIPELAAGPHRLKFRAWDILNNVSETELTFNVVMGLKPSFTISCTDNPARESTTFIIAHDRTGSDMDVVVDVFDMSGRQLWRHRESGVSTDSVYTVDWDLTLDSGEKLQTGVYLYRVHLTTDGGTRTSKAKKLVVISNK